MSTLAQKADTALANLAAYQTAHVTMAAAAEMVVDLTIDGTFTAAEALSALAEHVARYRDELAAIDGRAST
jgi:hypothetical protein